MAIRRGRGGPAVAVRLARAGRIGSVVGWFGAPSWAAVRRIAMCCSAEHPAGRAPDLDEEHPMKRTYQPKRQRRARKHGFRHRMQTRAGRAVVRNRRQKGRARLSA